MTKTKYLIEKIWWVIPPVVVVFGVLHFLTMEYDGSFSLDKYVFWLQFLLLTSYGRITTISMFVFMGIGYYMVRGESLALRIVVPTILATIGFFVGMYMAGLILGLDGAY